jgi:hypothetical protein
LLAVDVGGPFLYFTGTSDRLVPPSAAVEAQQCCRNMKVQSFEAPHCLLQVVPEEAAAVVADFIEKVAAP